MANCPQINDLPVLSTCPADDEQILFFNVSGYTPRMVLRGWADIKKCVVKVLPDDVYFVCKSSSPILQPGGLVFTILDHKGWKVNLFRGSTDVFQGNPGTGDPWFTFDPNTGIYSLSVAGFDGELFHAKAYKPA